MMSMLNRDLFYYCHLFDSMGFIDIYSKQGLNDMPGEFPKPETQINVLKRYLHVLALLENEHDPEKWNASSLADLLSLDEIGEPLSDRAIRSYIEKNLESELGLRIDKKRGGRKTRLTDSIPKKNLLKIAGIYANFVTVDSTRDMILSKYLARHPNDGLWMLARIYFAGVETRKISFNYKPINSRKSYTFIVHPYHIIFRNNNLYLYAKKESNGDDSIFILNKISDLKVLDNKFYEPIPDRDTAFKDSLGSFIGKKYRIVIKYKKEIYDHIDQIISILDPKITELKDDGTYDFMAKFSASDDRYLCKQLFIFGNRVELVEPRELRDLMIHMLEESRGVYK